MALKAFVCLCLCFQAVGGLKTAALKVDKDHPGIFNGPWNTPTHSCKETAEVGFDIQFCKNGWQAQLQQHQGKPCVVYDLGVRMMAKFALAMIEDFGCEVRAYDPSKVTAQWYDNDKNSVGAGMSDVWVFEEKWQDGARKLHKHEAAGKYKLWREAAGEKDGDLTLYEFDWQQVSNMRATEATKDKQEGFVVKSKSLPAMMKDNNDTYIDLLKIDIEGSELPFLKGVFDQMGCPPVEHILMEWHSQEVPGQHGAPAEVMAMEKRMEQCGYKKYNTYPFFGPNEAIAEHTQKTKPQEWKMAGLYYGLSGYCKTCV